jgi:hypothetical protein
MSSPRTGGSANYSPPRRTNLPRLKPAGSSTESSPRGRRAGGSARHEETMSVAASTFSQTSGCSSSTAAGLSPEQRIARRAIRERELAAHFARYNLPGFNTPGPGQYERKHGLAGGTFNTRPGQSPWSRDVVTQHETLDTTERPINPKKITHVGDPGRYVYRNHEIGNYKNNVAGVLMNSPLPQRPIATNGGGQPATLPWQVWSGR